MLHLAMLKRPLPGLRHFVAHHVGAAMDHGPYSHSNLVFPWGQSGSAWSDVGVDVRVVHYDLPRWDFVTLPGVDAGAVHRDLLRLRGAPYDHFGVLRFGVSLFREHPLRFFCHELIATVLGWGAGAKHGPSLLVARAIDTFKGELVASPWGNVGDGLAA